MPEMSRRSPSGKYILLPTTFKVPAVELNPVVSLSIDLIS